MKQIKRKSIITLLLASVVALNAYAQQEVNINAKAGQTINLQPSYNNQVIVIQGGGTAVNPAVIDGGGNTVITGNTQLYIVGRYIIVQNIKVQNPNLEQGIRSVVSFRYQKMTGNNCTLRNTQFTQDAGQQPPHSYSWLEVYGQNNMVTGCLFTGKTNRNPIVHVDVDDEEPDNNVLSNNTFTDVPVRPGDALEAIRVGLGKGVGGDIVKDNIFRRYNGDSETISSKSSGNTFSGNYFVECRAGISLRGGDNDVIANNKFFATKNCIRMAGSGHKITGNYFFNNPVNTSNGGLVLMVGGDFPACNYTAVKNIEISSNTFLNHLGLRVLKTSDQCNNFPQNIVFRQNKFVNAKNTYDLRDTAVADFGMDILPALKGAGAQPQAQARSAALGAKKASPETQRLSIETYKNGDAIFNNCDFGAGFFSPSNKGGGAGNGAVQDIQQKINDIRANPRNKK